jgi:drug/metabolite transporter (DMT)-like permease
LPQPSPLRGIALLLVAMVFFVLLDATGKHLAQRWPVPMLAWIRYTVHCLLMLALLGPSMGRALLRTTRRRDQVLRGLSLVGVTCFAMAAFRVMPLAETTAVLFAAPPIVALLAGPLLGEKITPVRWVAVAIGFAGVLLIARPGGGLSAAGIAFALAAAVCFAAYQLMTRQLAATETPVTMLFYTALVGSLTLSVALPWVWGGPRPGAVDVAMMLSLGVYGGCGHFLLIRAFREAPASLLSPITYGQLAWATLFGWLIFGELPDALALTGIAVIALAGVLIAVDGHRHASRARLAAIAASASVPE